MSKDAIQSLIYNTALLITLGVLYSSVISSSYLKRRYSRILSGCFIGLIGIAVMKTPWHFAPGINFDVRSILLSVAGLFFGTIPTIIAAAITILFRIHQGGAGTQVGILVIIVASGIGLLWRYYRPELYKSFKLLESYIFGFIVNAAMIACMSLLPWPQSIQVLQNLSLPIMIIYPIGTVILCVLLSSEYKRKQMEQDLDKERRQLLITMQSMGDGMIATDKTGVITLMNKVAEDLTGWLQEDAIGKPIDEVFKIVNEKTHQTVENPVAKVLASGRIEGLANHTMLIARDGTEYAIADSGAPICDEAGVIIGVVLIFRDQTEERIIQTKLLESEAHYHALADSGQALIWTSGLDMKCDSFNNPWLVFTGRSLEQELGDGWSEGVYPDDLEECMSSYTNSFNRRERFSIIYRLRRYDGEYRWILDEGSPRYNSKGEFIGYIGTCLDITKHVEDAEAMQQLLERFDLAAQAANLGVWDWDIVNSKLNWDDRMYELHGISRNDYPEAFKALEHSRHPNDYVTADEVLQQARSNNGVYNVESRVIWNDGSIRYLKSYGRLSIDAAGNPLRMTGVSYDITEQKESEKAILERDEILRYIVKYDPNAIAVYDLNLNYLAVSDRYLQDYDVKENDIIGRHHYDIFPEMPEKWKRVHQRCLAGEILRNDDDYFERPDGSITYNRWECRPWYRDDGTIGGMITYTEVTTERKVAEKALRESEERHRTILQTAMDGFWFADIEGHLLEVNESFCRMSGYSESELLKMRIADLEVVESHDDIIIHIQKIMTQGEDRFESQLHRKDGTIFDVSVKSQYQPIDDGRLVVFLQDITDRKRTEEKITEQLEELHRWHDAMIGRETRVLEVKKEVNDLLAQLGQPPRYQSVSDES